MYSTLRSGGKKILKQMPTMWELARRSEEMMKGMVDSWLTPLMNTGTI